MEPCSRRLCHLGCCCSTESPVVLGGGFLPVLPQGQEQRQSRPSCLPPGLQGLEKPPHVVSLASCGTVGRHQGLARTGAGLVRKVGLGVASQEQQPALFPLNRAQENCDLSRKRVGRVGSVSGR